jgi:hypothetical protein
VTRRPFLRFRFLRSPVLQAASTDYMVPEVNMNKLRIASAVAALTAALVLPAWGADATSNGTANLDQQVPSTSTQPTAPATSDSATAGTQQGSNSKANPRKHPPTAAMDSATPTEKTPTGKSAATKHPPTTQMDRAAPDEKSPGSTSSDSSTTSSAPASTTRN